jgi:hypothetical protein
MEQPILRPNFFIPIPRVCKGKERAREIQEFACSHRASHYFVHQKDAARESRHNEWHPGLSLDVLFSVFLTSPCQTVSHQKASLSRDPVLLGDLRFTGFVDTRLPAIH